VLGHLAGTTAGLIFTPVSLEAAKEKLVATIGDGTIEVGLAEMWPELD
jgi:hypothetical protein